MDLARMAKKTEESVARNKLLATNLRALAAAIEIGGADELVAAALIAANPKHPDLSGDLRALGENVHSACTTWSLMVLMNQVEPAVLAQARTKRRRQKRPPHTPSKQTT